MQYLHANFPLHVRIKFFSNLIIIIIELRSKYIYVITRIICLCKMTPHWEFVMILLFLIVSLLNGKENMFGLCSIVMYYTSAVCNQKLGIRRRNAIKNPKELSWRVGWAIFDIQLSKLLQNSDRLIFLNHITLQVFMNLPVIYNYYYI